MTQTYDSTGKKMTVVSKIVSAVDVSDAWSKEDQHGLIQASLAYAERTIWAEDEPRGDVGHKGEK